MSDALLLGYGYTARFVDQYLTERDWSVTGVRRNWAQADPTVPDTTERIEADLTQPGAWGTLPEQVDLVVNSLAAGRRGDPDRYRSVYRDVANSVVRWLETTEVDRYIYTGSVSVYGERDGEWVDESTEPTPDRATAEVLLETEDIYREARDSGLPITVVRLSGIYGPGRIRSVTAFRQGRVWYDPEDPHYLNKIRAEDIARGIHHLYQQENPEGLYNLSDGNPPERLEFYRWLAEELDRPVPEPGDGGPRSGNKRVLSDKLRQDGFRFEFPDFRAGLGPLIH